MTDLTPKQEAFALAYIETGNASEAYRQSYDVSAETKPETIWSEASRLMANPLVSARIRDLKAEAREALLITVGTLTDKLEDARLHAMKDEKGASAAVSAITNTGAGTAEYALYFHRRLSTTSKYFSVAAGTGHIESVSNTAGASGGEWRRTRNKGAGVDGDVLWNDVYAGMNTAASARDYVRVSGIIDTATAGLERGLYLVKTAINGTLTDQLGARNGLYVGAPTGGAQGTGSINLASSLLINANTVIDANRHLRLRSYAVASLPSASPAGMLIYVSDGTSNKRMAVSDGTNWRFPDGNIVS